VNFDDDFDDPGVEADVWVVPLPAAVEVAGGERRDLHG
jgi:hypothetical protein